MLLPLHEKKLRAGRTKAGRVSVNMFIIETRAQKDVLARDDPFPGSALIRRPCQHC